MKNPEYQFNSYNEQHNPEHVFAKEMDKPEEWSDDFRIFINKEREMRKLEQEQGK